MSDPYDNDFGILDDGRARFFGELSDGTVVALVFDSKQREWTKDARVTVGQVLDSKPATLDEIRALTDGVMPDQMRAHA